MTVELGRLGRHTLRSAWALWRPLALILVLLLIGIFVLKRVISVSWWVAGVSILSWFFGSGAVREGVTASEMFLNLSAGLLGYVFLGLLLWIITIGAKRAEQDLLKRKRGECDD